MMMVVLYYAGKTYWAPSYSYTWPTTGINFFGAHIGVTFVLGVGVILLSFVLMFITWPIYKSLLRPQARDLAGRGAAHPVLRRDGRLVGRRRPQPGCVARDGNRRGAGVRLRTPARRFSCVAAAVAALRCVVPRRPRVDARRPRVP